MRAEVRRLGAALGKVLSESGDPGLFEDVERLRKATIALRRAERAGEPADLHRIVAMVDAMPLGRAGQVAKAFTVYFHLANLAEERHRVRMLRHQSRGRSGVSESLEQTLGQVGASVGDAQLERLVDSLEISLVLTAHPTEARRRALIDCLRRIAYALEVVDDPRSGSYELSEAERRLLEQVTVLWRTSQVRRSRPAPKDEVRTVAAVFDESLFDLSALFCRAFDRALRGDATAVSRPLWAPFLRWGSWVGGDRDGNPSVTSRVTEAAADIQAEHALARLRDAARRVGRTLTSDDETCPPSPALAARLATLASLLGGRSRSIVARATAESHRQFLMLAAERLQASASREEAAYSGPAEFEADLCLLQDSLAQAGAARLAFGDLQHLVWQVQTFGFHLASLEVRQHSGVHRAALRELVPGSEEDARRLDDIWRHGAQVAPAASGATAEALEVLRAMARIQLRHGAEACRRYVVSMTHRASDVVGVFALARLAGVPAVELDVVPLFESVADLNLAPRLLEELLELPGWRRWLESRGGRLEVMLGYSDSSKDAGFLAANLALYEAQGAISRWARSRGLKLTLFHGRGGAVGRGGGPAARAIQSQAPHSVEARFKVTEQGEVIFARYRDLAIGQRHLEQLTSAVLLASTEARVAELEASEARYRGEAALMFEAAQAAYLALVESPGFAEFFARATPLHEISDLPIGSRPPRRAVSSAGLDGLRAIPFVFAWTQSRCNLPGWFGLGSGLEAVATRFGVRRLRAMYDGWPFFASVLDNAEMSLAKADPMIAEQYLGLGARPELKEAVMREFWLTRRHLLETLGTSRLLERHPVLGQAVDLRNPYVDALSFLQLRFLVELRGSSASAADRERLSRLVLLTVNGVAAGLQNTG